MPSDLPNDPVMLVSCLNTLLRDYYPSLADLCEDRDISESELTARLSDIGCRYDREANCIKSK